MSTDKEKREVYKKRLKIRRRIEYSIMGLLWLVAMIVAQHYVVVNGIEEDMSIGQKIALSFKSVFINPGEIFPPNITLLLVMLGIAGAYASIVYSNYLSRKQRQTDDLDTINGDAHLMTDEERKKYNIERTDPFGKETNDGKQNVIVSKEIYLTLDTSVKKLHGKVILPRNCNALVIGGSGAGKSAGFVGPNILQFNTNLIVTDPSGELLRDYGKALENEGYKVKVFNLTDVYRGNRYNPFHYIREEKDALILVNTIIKNTTPPEGHKGDDFWEKMETCLLTACVLYLWHTREAEKDKTFEKVIDLLHESEIDENDSTVESPLDRMFAELEAEDPTNLAVTQYKTFKLGAGKTLKETLLSVGVRLQAFKLDDIKYLTSQDELELDNFGDTKQALFIILPTGDGTFNFLAATLYSQLFMTLYTYCETRASFGWGAGIGGNEIYKVEHAIDSKDSKRAEQVINGFCASVKNGTEIVYNDERHVYEIYTTDNHELVTWRGDENTAKQIQKALAKIKPIKGKAKCFIHVRLILDEFANIGQIPEFDKKLATIRKYAISCAIILQGITQLQKMYKEDWHTLANNCDIKLLLGSDDDETIKFFISKIGKKTTKTASYSFEKDMQRGMNISRGSQDVLTADQVARMDDLTCLVLIRSYPAYKGPKFVLDEHPNYRLASETKGEFNIPLPKEALNRRSGPLWLQQKKRLEEIRKKNAEAHNSTYKTEPAAPAVPSPAGNNLPAEQAETIPTPAVSQPKAHEVTQTSATMSSSHITEMSTQTAERERERLRQQVIEEAKRAQAEKEEKKSDGGAENSSPKTEQSFAVSSVNNPAEKKKETTSRQDMPATTTMLSHDESMRNLMAITGIMPGMSRATMEKQMEKNLLVLEPSPESLEVGLTE